MKIVQKLPISGIAPMSVRCIVVCITAGVLTMLTAIVVTHTITWSIQIKSLVLSKLIAKLQIRIAANDYTAVATISDTTIGDILQKVLKVRSQSLSSWRE